MKLMDIYNSIDNPISDPMVIRKLVELYATCDGNFYSRMMKSTIKDHTKGERNKVDSDAFYSMMFNKWKKNILNTTREKFLELRRIGTYDNDFVLLRNFLKTTNDVKTKDEIIKLFNSCDNKISDAYYKYRWASFGEGTGWIHVASRYVTARNDLLPNVEHRLYINTDSLDTYKLLPMLYQKLEDKNIPIYFKFDEYGSRDDTIVIYASTKYLIPTYEVLKEIEKENISLVSRILPPPILTGKLDGWIGYGSEPVSKDGKITSFNKLRSEPVYYAISSTITDWIIKNANTIINYNNKRVSFRDYFLNEVATTFIEELRNNYSTSNSSDSELKNRYGYSKEDLNSPYFRNSIYKILNDNFNMDLSDIHMSRDINIIIGSKKYKIDKDILDATIQRLSIKIVRNDPSVIDDIKSSIIHESIDLGIDVDKYPFDLLRKKEMIIYDRDILSTKEEEKKNHK